MKKYFNLILLILWMLFIFVMSHNSAVSSSNQSSLITDFISKIFRIEDIEVLEFIIRKIAHLFEYFVLGLLMINYFKKYNNINYLFVSMLLCIIYAFTDEIHQLFIPGRNGNIKDIFIDSIGSLVSVISYYLIYKNNVVKKLK